MDIAIRILSGSPWWVYGLLALLVWLGLQAARPRTVSLSRVLIAPAVFIAWGIVSLMLRADFSDALVWLGTAACGAAFAGLVTRIDGVVADRRVGLVRVPGSILPLLRFLAIFIAKYALAVAASIRPDLRDLLAPWDIGVSGLAAGYFVGWLLAFLRAYRRAPDAELGAETLRVRQATPAVESR
jgi:hypothetical protein